MNASRPQTIKKNNEKLVLNILYSGGALTRPQIAKETKLSLPTTNKIIDILLKEDRIIEGGLEELASPGRRAKVYEFNKNKECVLTLYYYEADMIVTVANLKGEVLEQERYKTIAGNNKDKAYETIKKNITNIIKDQLNKRDNIKSIGIGLPGPIMLPCINHVEIREYIESKFKLNTYVENDVKLMTLGYKTKYRPKTNSLSYFYIGNGVNAGNIIDGKLYKGHSDFAGEFGYLIDEKSIEKYNTKPHHAELRILELRNELKKKHNKKLVSKYITLLLTIITAGIIFVSPQAIVLDDSLINEDEFELIKDNIIKYLPKGCVPEIERNIDNQCGVEGLISICLDGLRIKGKEDA